ncbi:Glycosyl transferase, family 8 [Artemisia annua]|uniref:Glycosyl transferase, family 8 n=1 Tax=Artemisia annua TaxID=35608 RepID=A0A2U1KJ09_ARTAN|nr:Glycosyl transferase, family 8 [Artemisia annua]
MASKVLLIMCLLLLVTSRSTGATGHRNAYATMMYMGTPRDYEFYVAIRVMLRSLSFKFRVDADLLVIASMDVPAHWIHTLSTGATGHRNAYATMMYMGTPRDYEFYVAIRVMLRSLSFKFRVDADLLVIASMDVPAHWIHTLSSEKAKKSFAKHNLKIVAD